MKEITKWSGEARYMWVWDDKVNNKEKRKVVYILDRGSTFPVVTVGQFDGVEFFKHAAEIEEESRIMTNQELAWWLREKPTREYKRKHQISIYYEYIYTDEMADDPADEDIVIRENGGKWVKPLISLLLD